MAIALVVKDMFAKPDGSKLWQRGDLIEDPKTVAAVEKDFPQHVVRKFHPDPVAPPPPPPVMPDEPVALDQPEGHHDDHSDGQSEDDREGHHDGQHEDPSGDLTASR